MIHPFAIHDHRAHNRCRAALSRRAKTSSLAIAPL
jgi:hypothetical protein